MHMAFREDTLRSKAPCVCLLRVRISPVPSAWRWLGTEMRTFVTASVQLVVPFGERTQEDVPTF